MRLWVKITIVISMLSIITAIFLSIFVNKQFKESLDKINFELSDALASSLSQSILDYVIEGNVRKTQEILRRIAKENDEIAYIVVIDFNNKFFATSVDVSRLPPELNNSDHLNCNVTQRIKDRNSDSAMLKNNVLMYDNAKVYDYHHPFVKNLSAHIHFGLKNSTYNKSVNEIREFTIMIVAIISILGTLIGYLLGKKMNLPLQQLSFELYKFGKTGKYDISHIKTGDKDIKSLFNSFKDMISQRLEYESTISDYKDSLEIKVKERTQELELEIKKHKKTEKNLLIEKEVSDKANSAKSEFLSHMSHELRTPLNAVLGFAQLLELEDSLTVQEYTQEILKAGYHLLALINDILDLSKIEAGKLELSVEEVNWNLVLEECYVLIDSLRKTNNITISCDYDKSKHFIVCVDRVRLKQACLNLISNAVKYNEKLGAVIVSFELTNNTLRMSVKDSGKGIPESKQKKLFSPFQRLDMEKEAIDGVGIGLVITKALVENMNGDIGFKSEYGIGSVFWIEFPLAKVEEHVSKVTHDAENKKDVRIISKNNRLPFDKNIKIIYIEDNPSNMMVVKNIFKTYSNVEFYSAYSPSEAFDILKNNNIDLVLLDINLPEMDGYDVKKILDNTAEYAGIKVVGVSANAMTHDIEKASAAGFSDYIAKPIKVSELIDVIVKVLSS